ncbi:hypothetical protein ACWGID_34990 [Kribbella sp. NPDC054772]
MIATGLQPRERDRSGGRWMVRVAAYYDATDCPSGTATASRCSAACWGASCRSWCVPP